MENSNAKGARVETFGWHLSLDLHACDPVKIRSKQEIEAFSSEICDLLHVRPHGKPLVKRFGLGRPSTAGYSLVRLIESSSIVAHFAEQTNSAYVDIFSCRPFDRQQLATHVARYFRASDMVEHFFDRM